MHVAVRFAKRPLGLDEFSIEITFDDDLGVRRHHDVVGLAFDHRDRLAGQTAGHTHLIDTVGNFLHGDIGNNRRCADHQRCGQMDLLLDSLLPMQINILAQSRGEHTDALAGFDLAAVVADVLNPGVEVGGEPVGTSGVRPIVESRRRDRHGKAVETVALFVELSALDDDFLALGVSHGDGIDRLG